MSNQWMSSNHISSLSFITTLHTTKSFGLFFFPLISLAGCVFEFVCPGYVCLNLSVLDKIDQNCAQCFHLCGMSSCRPHNRDCRHSCFKPNNLWWKKSSFHRHHPNQRIWRMIFRGAEGDDIQHGSARSIWQVNSMQLVPEILLWTWFKYVT